MPGQKRGVEVLKESLCEGGSFFLCAFTTFVFLSGLEDALSGDSVDRRLAQSGSMNASRSIRADRVAVPAPRAREVARMRSRGVKDYVRELASIPLSIEEGFELSCGAANIEMRESDG